MEKITVLITEAHTVLRQGLRALLQTEREIEIVGEAETSRQAVRLAKTLKPDVVVMDIALSEFTGLEATRQIVKEIPSSRVLILSSYSEDEYVHLSTEAGAAGYVLIPDDITDVVRAIREVKKGTAFFSPSISKRLADHSGVPVKKQFSC